MHRPPTITQHPPIHKPTMIRHPPKLKHTLFPAKPEMLPIGRLIDNHEPHFISPVRTKSRDSTVLSENTAGEGVERVAGTVDETVVGRVVGDVGLPVEAAVGGGGGGVGVPEGGREDRRGGALRVSLVLEEGGICIYLREVFGEMVLLSLESTYSTESFISSRSASVSCVGASSWFSSSPDGGQTPLGSTSALVLDGS